MPYEATGKQNSICVQEKIFGGLGAQKNHTLAGSPTWSKLYMSMHIFFTPADPFKKPVVFVEGFQLAPYHIGYEAKANGVLDGHSTPDRQQPYTGPLCKISSA